MNPLKSRKSLIATIASLFAGTLAGFAVSKGWVPQEKTGELVEAVVQAIMAIWGVVILGIAHEDAGLKVGLPPPAPAKKP